MKLPGHRRRGAAAEEREESRRGRRRASRALAASGAGQRAGRAGRARGDGETAGRTFCVFDDNERLCEETGFTNIAENRYKVPLRGWPRDPKLKMVGDYNFTHLSQGLPGFGMFVLTKVHNWDPTTAQVYLARIRQELNDKSIHAYYEGLVVPAFFFSEILYNNAQNQRFWTEATFESRSIMKLRL